MDDQKDVALENFAQLEETVDKNQKVKDKRRKKASNRPKGRTHRFPMCPHCGSAEGLDMYGRRKAGHVVNAYVRCRSCGWKGRFVSPIGKNQERFGKWVGVKTREKGVTIKKEVFENIRNFSIVSAPFLSSHAKSSQDNIHIYSNHQRFILSQREMADLCDITDMKDIELS